MCLVSRIASKHTLYNGCAAVAQAMADRPRPLPWPSPSDDGPCDVKAALLEFSRVAKSLSKQEEKALEQLVEVLKHHLRPKVFALLREAEEEPILFSYSADATPLKCSTAIVHVAGRSRVVRKGKSLQDFLLKRGFLKTGLAAVGHKITFLYHGILPMSESKKVADAFAAEAQFFTLLRKCGHKGISIQHACADLALWSSLDMLFRQRVQVYYTSGVALWPGEERLMLELTDWVVGTDCSSAHDLQNVVKRSLSAIATQKMCRCCI